MEPLSMPPMSQRCPNFVYRVYASFIQSPFTVMLLLERSWNLSRPFLNYLEFACRPFLVQVTGSCTLWSSPSTLSSFVEYLMLDDGGCLNALLPVDFIPLTLDHLFWDWNLDSCLSALRLAVISGRFSRHRQFLGLHQCPLIDGFSQVFDLNTFIHTC